MITKTEDGKEYTASAYAYVGDPEKTETWKLRIEETPGKVTVAQLGRAAAAFSPGGFRGEKVEIPAADAAGVKGKIRAAYNRLGVKDGDIPESVRASDAPRFAVDISSIELADLTRIPIAILGRFAKAGQKFAITKDVLRNLVENFRKRKTGETVIDYEHASEYPEVAQGGAVPAAGWLKEMDDGPDTSGILWGQAEFTPKAKEMIGAKEYKYLSPAIDWGARDKGTGEPQGATLTSVALVNRPFLEAMPAIQLSEGWALETRSSEKTDAASSGEREEERKAMLNTSIRFAEGDLKATIVCGECGKESSLLAEALPKPKAPKVVRLSDVKRDKDGRFDFASIDAGGEALIAGEVFHAQQVQAELDDAVKAGKITPAQRGYYEKLALSDLAGFRELVQTLPTQVDLSERGIAGTGEEGGRDARLAKIDATLREKALAKQKESPSITYGQALKVVLNENQDLRDQRAKLMRE